MTTGSPLLYANALTVDALTTIEAALLTSVSDAGVNTWAPESPQFGLLAGEALSIQTLEQQRFVLASTASVSALLGLPSALVALGYSPADAKAIASSWVDAKLEWFSSLDSNGNIVLFQRTSALQAQWQIGVSCAAASAPMTLTSATNAIFTAADGTVFALSISSPVTLASPSLAATVQVTARTGGASGNVIAGTIVGCSGPAGLIVNASAAQTLWLAGRDAETDSQAVRRALGRWAATGAGYTRAAFDYLIPTLSPNITDWSVNDATPFGPGTIGVSLADANGPATAAEVALVQAGLNSASGRPMSSQGAICYAAQAVTIPIVASLATDGSNPTLISDATSALQTLQSAITIQGCTIPISLIEALLQGGTLLNPKMFTSTAGTITLDAIFDGFGGITGSGVTLSSPSANIVLLPGQLPSFSIALTSTQS